ncbi:MAG: DUF1028 domain-containing protein, partial [Flavobacteriaceae bacterium]|nr:DUF1028 domain-containing protein [Flavobacteriaceae bacterium]
MKKTSLLKKLFFLAIVFASTLTINAQHTFSIVAVDPVTGEIGSAGATCLGFEDGAQAISDIVLGVGAIHTQSYWHPTNQANARVRMEAGDSPQEIMDWLIANDVQGDATARQYTAVDLNAGNPRSAAFTGANCFAEFIHIAGPNYSIAGNILISEDVVNDMETAFLANTGTLADKLMAAMQGAKRPGADARCLDDGVSSLSAFIRVADPSDTDSSYGNLSLDLNVWVTSDVFEPIDALQELYDGTLSVDSNSFSEETLSMYPNPANESITIQSEKGLISQYEIYDVTGKLVTSRTTDSPITHALVNVSDLNTG